MATAVRRGPPGRMLTSRQAAELLCVTTVTLIRYGKTGKLPPPVRASGPGGKFLWREDAVLKLLSGK